MMKFDDLNIKLPKKRMYIREFLNKPGFHSSGHVLAEVTDSRKAKEWTDLHDAEANLRIADCTRSINLDFYIGVNDRDSEEEFQNNLHKLDVLLTTIRAFRKAYKEEHETVKRLRKKFDKKEGKSE